MGEEKNVWKEDIRKYYDFSIDIVSSVLKDRSLIWIDEYEKIAVHDLIKLMGLEIAHQQVINEPGKPVRVWKHEDYCVLRNKVILQLVFILFCLSILNL